MFSNRLARTEDRRILMVISDGAPVDDSTASANGVVGWPIRRARVPLPLAPVIHVNAPGVIEAYRGHELVGKLQGGRLSGSRVDPFESEWLPGQFSGFLEELAQRGFDVCRRGLLLAPHAFGGEGHRSA